MKRIEKSLSLGAGSLESKSVPSKEKQRPQKPESPFTFSKFDAESTRDLVSNEIQKYAYSEISKDFLCASLNEASAYSNPDVFTRADYIVWNRVFEHARISNTTIGNGNYGTLPSIIRYAVEAARAVHEVPYK